MSFSLILVPGSPPLHNLSPHPTNPVQGTQVPHWRLGADNKCSGTDSDSQNQSPPATRFPCPPDQPLASSMIPSLTFSSPLSTSTSIRSPTPFLSRTRYRSDPLLIFWPSTDRMMSPSTSLQQWAGGKGREVAARCGQGWAVMWVPSLELLVKRGEEGGLPLPAPACSTGGPHTWLFVEYSSARQGGRFLHGAAWECFGGIP
jgi:hypothetical protein